MGYRVFYEFDNGEMEDVLDEVFRTKKEAEEAAAEGAGNYAVGRDVLRDAGEDYSEEDIVGWTIVKE